MSFSEARNVADYAVSAPVHARPQASTAASLLSRKRRLRPSATTSGIAGACARAGGEQSTTSASAIAKALEVGTLISSP